VKRSYLLLVAAVIVAAIGLTIVARMPRRASAPGGEEATAPGPVVELALGIRDGRVDPPVAQAPKGARIHLTVTNQGTAPARLSLAGYEMQLSIPELAPGASWTGEFTASLPGDDFAWVLNGAPSGRFAVTGSHLVEGHR
jgi:hypothetical protein